MIFECIKLAAVAALVLFYEAITIAVISHL